MFLKPFLFFFPFGSMANQKRNKKKKEKKSGEGTGGQKAAQKPFSTESRYILHPGIPSVLEMAF